MKTMPWIYFQNPFINATRNNYKKAVKISTYTDAQLFAQSADAFYGPLYIAYHPLHLALVLAYNNWKVQGGAQKGSTFSIAQLLVQLRSIKIALWDIAVQGLFAKSSSDYMTIFPKGRNPFQVGAKLARINAVAQLVLALTGIVKLKATLKDVTDFGNLLTTANSLQMGNMGSTTTLSDAVETARINAFEMMFGILGSCIWQFKPDPSVATVIFDLETVRSRQQTIFTGSLKLDAFKNIAERTFLLTDIIDVKNDGLSILGYYLAKNKDDGPYGYTVLTVASKKDLAITIDEFLNDTLNKFLCVVNLSSLLPGHYTVDLV